MEALELKNTIRKRGANKPQWAQQQNDRTKEIVSEFEDRTTEITQSK